MHHSESDLSFSWPAEPPHTLHCFNIGSSMSLQAWQRIAASIDMQAAAPYSKLGSRMSHLEQSSERGWF